MMFAILEPKDVTSFRGTEKPNMPINYPIRSQKFWHNLFIDKILPVKLNISIV